MHTKNSRRKTNKPGNPSGRFDVFEIERVDGFRFHELVARKCFKSKAEIGFALQSTASYKPGFILVTTLILMVLLSLLVMAMLALSSVSLRATDFTNAQANARANAKLALTIAIGQLQLHAGKDVMITAPGAIRDTRPAPDENWDPAISNPRFLLAFQSTRLEPEGRGRGLFLRVPESTPATLVSGNERFFLDKSGYPKGYVGENTNLLEMLHEGNAVAMNDNRDQADVHRRTIAPLVRMDRGSYAYWIADEAVKARVDLHDSFRSKNAGLSTAGAAEQNAFVSLLAPARLGIENAGADETEGFLKPAAADPEISSRMASNANIFSGQEQSNANIRKLRDDFTVYSSSVLSDSQNGGLKKNLTSAFNLPDAEFEKLLAHSGAEADQASPVFLFQRYSFPPENTDSLTYKEYPGTVWEAFRSYARSGEWETISGPAPKLKDSLGTPSHKEISHYWENYEPHNNNLRARLVRRTPVLVRFQLAVDYSVGYNGIVEEDGREWHDFTLRQHFMPLVIYWNPYNVELETTEPKEFAFYTNRDWGTGKLNTSFRLWPAGNDEVKVLGLANDVLGSGATWISAAGADSISFLYPFSPKGNKESKYELTNLGFTVPKFTVGAGETKVFGITSRNIAYFSNARRLDPLATGNQLSGFSAYSTHSKIRVAKSLANQGNWQSVVPELEIVSFPSQAGWARLQMKNTASFQRTNWQISSVVNPEKIRFVPVVIGDGDRLPQADANGTESPKFAAVLIRKFPDVSRYFPETNTPWKAYPAGTDTNQYQAPWAALYNFNASRYGAYGAAPGRPMAFASPPAYMAGVIIGKDSYHLIAPEIDSAGKGFTGYNDTAAGGSVKAVVCGLPRSETPLLGVGELRGLDTSRWLSNYASYDMDLASATDAVMASSAIGNSFASPHIALGQSFSLIRDNTGYDGNEGTAVQYDASFRYNQALWDRYYFSGEKNDDAKDKELLGKRLPNGSLKIRDGASLEKFKDPHFSASCAMLEGGFNVNSTSVEAWKVLLSATIGMHTSGMATSQGDVVPFPRMHYANASAQTTPPADVSNPEFYDGSRYRALTKDEITTLAEEIVKQNKLRGPYATVSAFVNRSLSAEHHLRKRDPDLPLALTDSQVCYEGTIQAAINASGINGAFDDSNAKWPPALAVSSPSDVAQFEEGKINPAVLKYHSGYGNPATLTQADVLARIGHLLVARSDTFSIRCYGDARDSAGKVIARAWCEAVVQRVPEFVGGEDPSTPPERWELSSTTIPTDGTWSENPALGKISSRFGRCFRVSSFRWLTRGEIE